jgi:hypothetical protein
MFLQTIIPRTSQSTDWATVLFIFCFLLIAISKSAFEKRFIEFSRLAISDKYVKIYRDAGFLFNGFTILLFIVQVVSFAFFIQIILAQFGLAEKTDWIVFVQICTVLTTFILIRFLIDKIIGTAFNIDDFVEHFNLEKVSYRTYLGLILLPVNMLLFYGNFESKTIICIILILLLILNFVTYLFSLKNYQNYISGKFFYFILYLCALEIAPYYFMYYWFTKN